MSDVINTGDAGVGSPPSSGDNAGPTSGAEAAGGDGASPGQSSPAANNGHSNGGFQPAQSVPPSSWSRDLHEDWGQIPERARQYISQREREAHKAITEYGNRVKQYEPYDRIAKEHAEHFQRYGVTPDQALAAHVQLHSYLDRDPAGFIRDIAQRYGVDLTGPQVAQVQQQIVQAQQEMVRQREQFEQSTFRQFAKDKPHLANDRVRSLTKQFLENGTADDPEMAYQMAVQATGADAEERIKREAEAAAKRAAEARRAAQVNVRSDAGGRSQAKKSMSDTIDELGDRFYGRR